MPEIIIDGTGAGYAAKVISGGRLLVDISGQTINIGSVSAHVDSIYVQSGNIILNEIAPTDSRLNNYATSLVYITSGTSTGISTGSEIGTIIKYGTTGSYVRTLTYSNNNLINIGSWV